MGVSANDRDLAAEPDPALAEAVVPFLMSLSDFELRPLHVGQTPPSRSDVERQLRATLGRDQALFLEKWGHRLGEAQLRAFEPLQHDDYEVRFHLARLHKQLRRQGGQASQQSRGPGASATKAVRNRRLRYMQVGLDREYFSLEAMRDREPELYEQFVGRFVSERERSQPFPASMGLVERIYHDIDDAEHRRRLGRDTEESSHLERPAGSGDGDADQGEEEQIVEYDTDSESEDADPGTGESAAVVAAATPEPAADRPARPFVEPEYDADEFGDGADELEEEREYELELERTLEERAELENELRRIMRERFVDGLDSTFRYSEIDDDEGLDDLDMIGADEQDRYFDED
ncbi:hypothetical protein HK105_205425 [Polyrhizophydium stewartii]|uniref:CCD97-like C-terminal domain-containing protein n=1 Tax=Polyrhizophydium stewartii TaxID=2732419 RepID=A0ABR4N6D3_9FUNG|nr:hypothetical protein HK105_006114 [Polyrhizophydium stewartii]